MKINKLKKVISVFIACTITLLLLSASNLRAQLLFDEDFSGVSSGTDLQGAATGSGIFTSAWQTQYPGDYSIINTTPLDGNGNYAIGGGSYTGAARDLSATAAGVIDPNLVNSNGLIGGNGLTLTFSALVRVDQTGQSSYIGLGNSYFDGGGVNPGNSALVFGDINHNGTFQFDSRGTDGTGSFTYTVGQTYLLSLQAVYDPSGQGATLTFSVNGTQIGSSLVSTNATFNALGYYGGDGSNRTSIDNLILTEGSSVPEPSTYALLLGGLGLILLTSRLRASARL